jgi:PAS domain-containing protein
VILTDGFGKVVDADARAAGLLGYRPHEMQRLGAQKLGLPREGDHVEVVLRHRDGSEVAMFVSVVAFMGENAAYRLNLLETPPRDAEEE